MQHVALLPLPVSDDELIPASRLSAFIPIAAQTLARWRCEGQGPAFVKIGRRVAYRAGDVRAWLRQRVRSNTIECPRAVS
jgi:predicted DNA-binding transcriptional regulator AlpA